MDELIIKSSSVACVSMFIIIVIIIISLQGNTHTHTHTSFYYPYKNNRRVDCYVLLCSVVFCCVLLVEIGIRTDRLDHSGIKLG